MEAMMAELDKLQQLDSLPEDEAVVGAYPAYWKDLLSYDPVKTAETITKPVLVLQGEEDYQVPLQEFETWKAAYGEKANWTFHSYSGLSHMMERSFIHFMIEVLLEPSAKFDGFRAVFGCNPLQLSI